ncbi:unnamed protein product, partial [Ectocarpus sp. 6 AP-2014]
DRHLWEFQAVPVHGSGGPAGGELGRRRRGADRERGSPRRWRERGCSQPAEMAGGQINRSDASGCHEAIQATRLPGVVLLLELIAVLGLTTTASRPSSMRGWWVWCGEGCVGQAQGYSDVLWYRELRGVRVARHVLVIDA